MRSTLKISSILLLAAIFVFYSRPIFAGVSVVSKKDRDSVETELYRDINERFLREDYHAAVRLAKQYLSAGYEAHAQEVQELKTLSASQT